MRISVIIPALNEAGQIAEVVRSTRSLGQCEIIVVDGSSRDQTAEEASEADLVLKTPPGRAIQQNAGAAASTGGDVLLFLHADCRLGSGSFEAVRKLLEDPRIVGGCFRQRIDDRRWRYRLIERGNALRVRALGWAYGDQGIFVRRPVFEKLGGFPEVRLMEDLFFMKKLKREGRFVLIDPPIQISARRWQKKGLVRQTMRNWTLITLAHLGVSPDRLAKFYPHVR